MSSNSSGFMTPRWLPNRLDWIEPSPGKQAENCLLSLRPLFAGLSIQNFYIAMTTFPPPEPILLIN
jgi:hypothetical protein